MRAVTVCMLAAVCMAGAARADAAEPREVIESLRSDLAPLQRELSEAEAGLSRKYETYSLDSEAIGVLESHIIELRRRIMARYRQAQVELRAVVDEAGFAEANRRMQRLLTEGPGREGAAPRATADPVFSGPQVGEKLPPFKVRGVFDDEAGKEIDFIERAAGKPIVLIFVHDVNRQSISMVRLLTGYTLSRAKDGLTTGVVWLDDDATEAENTLKRIRHALTPGAPTGISLDGEEGPGSYGLNRNVMLTILVGNESKVTANFALVQPSIAADLPKVLEAVVKQAGGDAPKLEDLPGAAGMMRRAEGRPNAGEANNEAVIEQLRGLLRPVIQREMTPGQVDEAAAKVEGLAKENEAARREVGRIANTIIDAGKLSNYGTERAQEYLRKWAKEYGSAADGNPSGGGSER